MSDSPLIASLASAVAANPDDHPLRLHLAQLLLEADAPERALPHVSHVLLAEPRSAAAHSLMTRVTTALASPPVNPAGFDWSAAEDQVGDLVGPMFVEVGDTISTPIDIVDNLERPKLRLTDVGGMQQVKDRLETAFLAPMRNPELWALYGKSLRGGLLLYGPPGCGKTYLARALAGELGANFSSISLADVLDMYIGQSERNLHAVFETVRQNTPCVLFLDELDALGQKRSLLRGSAMRGTVNQLLAELDGVQADNEGLFILAATNHPWDIDSALRRPGRLDRMLLVLPPDEPAREAILRHHLKDRPVARIELGKIVAKTAGFSGADLAHLCDTAAEVALLDSVRSGNVRVIEMSDFSRGLKEIKPSTGSWFQTAKNVAMFSNEAGEYEELVDYLRANKQL